MEELSLSKSLLGQIWKLREQDPGLNIIQNIIKNRGLTGKKEVTDYLNPNIKKGFHNPFLMKDMDKAVARLNKAIQEKERIIIFGDYDVDGISGTAILYNTLKLCGANVSYRLPHRQNDGYGLNIKFIDEFKEKKVKLLVTVDCGISCATQISKAKGYGIDTIVTDHHTIPEEIPTEAYAILHPKQEECQYPFKGLTGAGVAYKLASALITDRYEGPERDRILYSLLDLASLGTVADMGPLLGENRIIVKYGLEAMQQSNWQGLNLLMESAGIDLSQPLGVTDIGFKIGPRINAAGRIDHPYHALQMLLHEGDIEEGKVKASHLEKLNSERQKMVQIALEEAELKVAQYPTDRKIFIAWSPDWHVGILGLICSKIVEKYGLPTIILQEFDDHLVASFRSNEKLNAFEALLNSSEFLDHFGGHAQAAGFSLKKDKLETFIESISDYAADILEHHEFEQELFVDAILEHQDINENFMRLLEQMEPFGIGNQKPVFVLKEINPTEIKTVGKEKQHLHFQSVTGKGQRFSSIAFKQGKLLNNLQVGQKLDIAIHLEKNIWNGRESIQFQIVDLRPSSS